MRFTLILLSLLKNQYNSRKRMQHSDWTKHPGEDDSLAESSKNFGFVKKVWG